jgi:hypothetical protein
MFFQLRQYLYDAYESRHNTSFSRKLNKSTPIQIDDQDDNDQINEFCNVFCTVRSNDSFCIELIGNFPITSEIEDLIDIYGGKTDRVNSRLLLELNIEQIDVLIDLADKIRKTSFLGTQNNPGWLTISSRTISSLYRFVRIVKEYKNLHKNSNISKFAILQSVIKSNIPF